MRKYCYLETRLKNIEKQKGIGSNSPIIILDYPLSIAEKEAKEMGIPLDQYEDYLNRNDSIKIRVEFV